MAHRIHLDHNATTPLREEVRTLLVELLDRGLGNPSSLHASGREARQLIDDARERVAAALDVHEDGVLFTSGGTESNNLALRGALAAAPAGAGLATSTIEHAAVLEPAAQLATRGRPWVQIECDGTGRIDPERVAQAVANHDLALVSVMAANNELGTVQDLPAIADLVREHSSGRTRLHTDAVQAIGKVPFDPSRWGVDMASLSPHKLGGPVGVGILIAAPGTSLEPLVFGGGQERGLRPGTENAAAIAAAALAVQLAVTERDAYAQRVGALASGLWRALHERLDGVRLLGPPIDPHGPIDVDQRLPNTLNVLLPGVDGRVLVTRLDLEGLEASAGSACASGSVEPSHVLRAIGLDEEDARAGLRLSLGRRTTAEDCAQAVEILVKTCRGTHATRHTADRL